MCFPTKCRSERQHGLPAIRKRKLGIVHGGDNCGKRRAGSSGLRLCLGGAEPFPPIDKVAAHDKYWQVSKEIKEKSSELRLLCFPQNTRKFIRGHLTSQRF